MAVGTWVGIIVTSSKNKVRNFEFSVNLFDILQNLGNFTKVQLVLWEGRQFTHVSDFQTHVLTDKYTSCFRWYFVVTDFNLQTMFLIAMTWEFPQWSRKISDKSKFVPIEIVGMKFPLQNRLKSHKSS